MSSGQGGGFNKSHELATQYAIDGLKALILVHGGAVVAILSFAGSAGRDRINPALVASSLTWFIYGLFTALGVFLTTYTAQSAATHGKNKRATLFEVLGYLLVLASLGFFVCGALSAKRGFTTAEQSVPAVVAACELEGVRLYQNPATRDERVGEYIITCMKTKGYSFTVISTPCAISADLRNPACYLPAKP